MEKKRAPRNRTLVISETEQISLKEKIFFTDNKNFHGFKFSKTNDDAYLEYLESWFPKIMGTLKPADSV
ncbi:MAG: hypothetical protein LBO76_03705, partial [Treponema sp.]|nr:hypothetical protein [Treponema sp.]